MYCISVYYKPKDPFMFNNNIHVICYVTILIISDQ